MVRFESGIDEYVSEQNFERTHLRSSRDRTPSARINPSRIDLTLLLSGTRVPELLYCILKPLIEIR
jgi:hypothetical protein